MNRGKVEGKKFTPNCRRISTATGISLQEVPQRKEANRHDKKTKHLPKRNRVIKLGNNRQGGQCEPGQLQEAC